jgi:hypothetical protein
MFASFFLKNGMSGMCIGILFVAEVEKKALLQALAKKTAARVCVMTQRNRIALENNANDLLHFIRELRSELAERKHSAIVGTCLSLDSVLHVQSVCLMSVR